MITGTTVLAGFDRTHEEASREFEAASQDLQRLADRLMRLRAAEGEAYRELAELRLTAAASDRSALDGLAAAGSRIRALLEANAGAVKDASEAVAKAEAAVKAARAARDAADRAADDAEVAQAEGIEAARTRLAADPEWARLRDAAEAAERMAKRAEEKTRAARADRETKGGPYEADPLFDYLWKRGFGTPAYRGRGIVRTIDGWVAKVAAFEPARRNFQALDALPGRLADHTARLQEEAKAAAEALARFELAAAEAAGAPARSETDRLRRVAEAAEDALEAAERKLTVARERITKIAGGEDEGARAALRELETVLTRTDLKALRQAAARTPDERDDAIVQRLIDIEGERARAEREIADRRQVVESARAKLGQVEALRTEYRRRGWQGDAWDFKDGAMVGILIGEVLKGSMGQDGFWERMGRHRRGRDPWGGAAGGGSPWGGAGGGRSGGFGGGGFRTGGGFGGGGGFKTGGGF